MTGELRWLTWETESARTRWLSRGSAWVGAYENWQQRQGTYVSGRGSMMIFALAGSVAVVVGPERRRVELARGDVLAVKSRTPFLFELERARMLIAELEAPDRIAESAGLRHIRSAALPRAVSAWMRECWTSPVDLLHAGEVANQASQARGETIGFPAAHNTLRMLAVKRELEAFYTEPIRLSDVARSFKLDPFYLSRGFTRTTGIAPKEFLQCLRFEHFLRALLAQPDRSLTRLAFEAGAPDYSAFCRWLKQRLGVSPSGLVREGSFDQVFPSTPATAPLACADDSRNSCDLASARAHGSRLRQ